MEEEGPIYIRVRRERSTYFMTVQSRESVQTVKRRLQAQHKGLQLTDIQLYDGSKLLDDKSNLHDQGICTNTLLYYRLRKGTDWEDMTK